MNAHAFAFRTALAGAAVATLAAGMFVGWSLRPINRVEIEFRSVAAPADSRAPPRFDDDSPDLLLLDPNAGPHSCKPEVLACGDGDATVDDDTYRT